MAQNHNAPYLKFSKRPRGETGIGYRNTVLAQNNGKRNLFLQNCFHKIDPKTMPKGIGYTISTIILLYLYQRQDDQNWYR